MNEVPNSTQGLPKEPWNNVNSHDLPRLAYRVEEVARQLDVDPVTVRRLVARRLLRRAPGLRHLRVTADSIGRYLHADKNNQ